ncbi:hypothetical protein RF55_19418 [Lasius niger]|uniref:Uncharacterized protein n=1 Tax=Lasius niger TaxID=67767 RepID=A0A0J7K022_LASNI|nr:hypothetical protein RF55_19418 [Lasius niger]
MVIFGKTFSKIIKNLKNVFLRLREADLKKQETLFLLAILLNTLHLSGVLRLFGRVEETREAEEGAEKEGKKGGGRSRGIISEVEKRRGLLEFGNGNKEGGGGGGGGGKGGGGSDGGRRSGGGGEGKSGGNGGGKRSGGENISEADTVSFHSEEEELRLFGNPGPAK